MASIIDSEGSYRFFKVIVIEGPDGVGKTTFSANFTSVLRKARHPYIRVHFPNKKCWHSTYNGRNERMGGNLVATPVDEYLHSQINIVGNPRAVSHIYTQDRLLTWYMDGYMEEGVECLRSRVIEMCKNTGPTNNIPILLIDRYTQSSEIYQGVDMLDEEQDKFCDWLEDYEYNILGLPKPDRVIYLDAPTEWVIKTVNERAKLIGFKKDIHEVDNDFLADVCVAGRKLSVYRDWDVYYTSDGKKWNDIIKITEDAYNAIFPSAVITD